MAPSRGAHPDIGLFLGQKQDRHGLLVDGLQNVIRIGGQKTIEIIARQAVRDLSHARPLRHMDASKEHQGLAFVVREPGIGSPATVFLAGRIGFRETGDRNRAATLDTKPTLPVREIEGADIRGAAIHLIA